MSGMLTGEPNLIRLGATAVKQGMPHPGVTASTYPAFFAQDCSLA